MIIKGIESAASGKKYCVHNPIRIRITPSEPDCLYMEVSFTADKKNYTTRFYPVDNLFELELQEWFKSFFTKYECPFTYQVSLNYPQNPNLKTVQVEFTEYYLNGEDRIRELKTTREVKIMNAANNQSANYYQSLEKQVQMPKRYWQGYPFSLLKSRSYSLHYTHSGSSTHFPLFDFVHEVQDALPKSPNGIYVRWLAPDTQYNYWLFPFIEEKGTAKEIGSTDRWFLNEEEETSNEDSLGLTQSREFTLMDKIPKKYWELLNTLYTSPEVYILKKEPHQSEYTATDWEKVRVKGGNYTNKSYENAQEYSISFQYKKQYSQTL